MSTNASIESEIQAKGLTAPRVTPADIEANIAEEYFTTAAAALKGTPGESSQPLKLLTLCVLVLRNGFTVLGTSACASPANFDAELGRKIARADAVNQMWPLMGYALKETLVGPTVAPNVSGAKPDYGNF
jgi:hypothetical protein